jgi:hypothetical protein
VRGGAMSAEIWPVGNNMRMFGYHVIVADPPWTFELRPEAGEGESPPAQYKCMSLDTISRRLSHGRRVRNMSTPMLRRRPSVFERLRLSPLSLSWCFIILGVAHPDTVHGAHQPSVVFGKLGGKSSIHHACGPTQLTIPNHPTNRPTPY